MLYKKPFAGCGVNTRRSPRENSSSAKPKVLAVLAAFPGRPSRPSVPAQPSVVGRLRGRGWDGPVAAARSPWLCFPPEGCRICADVGILLLCPEGKRWVFFVGGFFFFLNVKIKTRPGGGEASHHNSFLLQCFQSQPNLPLMSAACWARDQELLQNMPAKCK